MLKEKDLYMGSSRVFFYFYFSELNEGVIRRWIIIRLCWFRLIIVLARVNRWIIGLIINIKLRLIIKLIVKQLTWIIIKAPVSRQLTK
jgi:hypothetical protein